MPEVIFEILRALVTGDRIITDSKWVQRVLADLDKARGTAPAQPAAEATAPAPAAEGEVPAADVNALLAELASLRAQLADAQAGTGQ